MAKRKKSALVTETVVKVDQDCPAKSSKTDIERPSKLSSEYYNKPCLELAKSLLGKVLCRRTLDGAILSGKIVETEGYPGISDPSAHSYKGKTPRNGAMFMDPGTAYVYNIYGLYCCLNISSQGEGHAVLLRALEPLENLEKMRCLRQLKNKPSTKPKPMSDKDLCSGPSKFCQALDIRKNSINELDLRTSDVIWLEDGDAISDDNIIVSTRIGIEGAGAEAVSKPLRFYVRGNVNVSKRDKKAEGLK